RGRAGFTERNRCFRNDCGPRKVRQGSRLQVQEEEDVSPEAWPSTAVYRSADCPGRVACQKGFEGRYDSGTGEGIAEEGQSRYSEGCPDRRGGKASSCSAWRGKMHFFCPE